MSVKYCLPVFHFLPKLYRTLQRGLSAIAEHLVSVITTALNGYISLNTSCHSNIINSNSGRRKTTTARRRGHCFAVRRNCHSL